MNKHILSAVPFGLFFLSGGCALVYEVVWSRTLVPVLGNTTIAVASILAAYMAGLSLGSYFWGRYADAHKTNFLKLFGILELGTGIISLCLYLLISFIIPFDVWVARVAGMDSVSRIGFRFGTCFTLFLPLTFLIGGTFAVLGKAVIRPNHHFGGKTALLYGLNTAGGVLGVFLAGFFLIRLLGHRYSLFLTSALNAAIGLGALAAAGKTVPFGEKAAELAEKFDKQVEGYKKGLVPAILAGVAVSGFCALAYELLWTRLLLLVMDNSVYSFAVVLMFFLLGISLGGLIGSFLLKRITRQGLFFGALQIGVAISAFLFPFFIFYIPQPAAKSYFSFLFLNSPALMLIPTTFMGMTLPVGAHIYQQFKQEVATSIGTVVGINTLGGAGGVVTACFFLIPVLGFQESLLMLAALSLAVGILILVFSIRRPLWSLAWCIAALLLAYGGYKIMPPGFFAWKYSALEPESRLIYYNESRSANAAVFQRPDYTRALYLNGIPELNTRPTSLRTFRLMGALPALIHPKPENALIITYGAGITAGMTAQFVNEIHCVDIAEQAGEIAVYFSSFNNEVNKNPNFTLYADDARHFLQNSTRNYSLIISDATHPRVYDSWVLFTLEFYQAAQLRLADKGIFLQWVPFHGLEPDQYKGIVKTFQHVFQHTSIWSVNDTYSLLLATPEPLEIDFRALFKKMIKDKATFENLQQAGLENPLELLSCFVMAEKNVRKMTAGCPLLLTDDSPAHLFFSFSSTFKDQYKRWPSVNSGTIKRYRESIIPYLTNLGRSGARRRKILNILRYYERRGD